MPRIKASELWVVALSSFGIGLTVNLPDQVVLWLPVSLIFCFSLDYVYRHYGLVRASLHGGLFISLSLLLNIFI